MSILSPTIHSCRPAWNLAAALLLEACASHAFKYRYWLSVSLEQRTNRQPELSKHYEFLISKTFPISMRSLKTSCGDKSCRAPQRRCQARSLKRSVLLMAAATSSVAELYIYPVVSFLCVLLRLLTALWSLVSLLISGCSPAKQKLFPSLEWTKWGRTRLALFICWGPYLQVLAMSLLL